MSCVVSDLQDSFTVYRIDQQLRELSRMLPEYSVDGYGAYVDDDDDDEEYMDGSEEGFLESSVVRNVALFALDRDDGLFSFVTAEMQ